VRRGLRGGRRWHRGGRWLAQGPAVRPSTRPTCPSRHPVRRRWRAARPRCCASWPRWRATRPRKRHARPWSQAPRPQRKAAHPGHSTNSLQGEFIISMSSIAAPLWSAAYLSSCEIRTPAPRDWDCRAPEIEFPEPEVEDAVSQQYERDDPGRTGLLDWTRPSWTVLCGPLFRELGLCVPSRLLLVACSCAGAAVCSSAACSA
jgi:hypothetical protein